MTKAELVAKIAEDTDLTQAQATKALNSLLATMIEEIKDSGSINLAGLGSFTLITRAARTGFNPKTKEPLKIPASKSVKFKCSKTLKDSVNGR
ncbi:MAG: HU family DNA-binding protein [Deltaproteobacteria bacterium]|jgi:DNA-binding protein HU-beta|nr:HU family DNA-binding protein [Deltaproteobacteria bacterium]